MRRTILVAGLATALLLVLAAVAAGRDYSFTEIADTADGFGGFGCPAINSRGAVAFTADDSVRRGSGGPLTTIADEGDDFSFFGNPSINERGVVSFAARFDEQDGEVIARGSGGPLTEIARTEPGRFNFFTFDTSLNTLGRVAFTAELDEELGFDEGLFVGDGVRPPVTRYLASTSPFQGAISPPSINEFGQVAFFEVTDGDVRGIFRQTGSTFTTIADENGPLQGFSDRPSLNNLGRVAFTAFTDDAFTQGVFTGRGGALDEVANTEGEYGFFGDPSLNDLRGIAFSAELDTFDQGIFTGPDPVDDEVIRSGDALLGSRAVGLTACREALNIFGQIAFRAQLEDGREVIVRATPRRARQAR